MIVVNELNSARPVAYEIGLALKVPLELLNRKREESRNQRDLLVWIIEEFLRQDNPRPTWRIIVEALRSPMVQRPKLAKIIEDKYCTSAEGN